MAELLQNEHAGSLAHDEAVALPVEGTGGLLRVVVAGGERPRGAEAGNTKRRDGRLAAAINHHVGIYPLDGAKRLTDGVIARGTSCDCGEVRSIDSVADGDLA